MPRRKEKQLEFDFVKKYKKKGLESEVNQAPTESKERERLLSRFYENLYKELYKKIKEESKKSTSYLEKRLGSLLAKEYEKFDKKYSDVLKGIERYTKTMNKYKEQGMPQDKILNSPAMEHYKYALIYSNELRAGMNAVKKAESDLKEWFDKYGMPLAGISGYFKRKRALIELGKYKERAKKELYEATGDVYKKMTAAIILALTSSILLTLSTANITGFAIANKTIESAYPVSAGFILLIIALFLLLKNPKRKPRR